MDMKRYILFIVVFINYKFALSQLISVSINQDNEQIKARLKFIRSYFNDKSDIRKYWLPRGDATDQYNYSTLVDGISRYYAPWQMLKYFQVEITELQILNDSLSYYKFILSNKKDKHIVEYKYYIVKRDGVFYIDNCMHYEKRKFVHVNTPLIDYFISSWLKYDTVQLMNASKKLDSLSKLLVPKKTPTKIVSFICASTEEMNLLTNMTHYYGYVGGFTHLDCQFIVSHNAPPDYIHEFIHVILGETSGNSFILGEGIASYFGGPSYNFNYSDALLYLKDCFESGRCTFDLLLQKKIFNPRDNYPTYSFAAVLCDYIINAYGYNYFYSLYNNKEISDDNLIEKICKDHNIARELIEQRVINKIMKQAHE
jgi:hypothetical protein